MSAAKINRKLHRWGSVLVALPFLVILLTGILLLVKKEFKWIQPGTEKGVANELQISFEEILAASATVPEAEIRTWDDVDRLDVRPGKGVVKVRSNNRWEIQIATNLTEGKPRILQVAYRRSDLIESLHDGSFFHDKVKLYIFLPSALILVVLWVTGIYLFFLPYLAKKKKRKKKLKTV